MKTIAWFTALGLVVFSSISLGLDKERVAGSLSKWKLQVDLIDGSRIVGNPAEKTLKLDLGFSELTIPFDRVRRAQWDRGHKAVRVELTNRDMISGQIMMKQIAMDTLFGEVMLKTKQMKSLEVIPADRLALPSERDLVLYYSFDRDDGARVINQASDQLCGRATGIRWFPEGPRGGAIDFDGNASVEIPHHELLCPETLTMAAWIYPRNGTKLRNGGCKDRRRFLDPRFRICPTKR